jgi:hypothetical protein
MAEHKPLLGERSGDRPAVEAIWEMADPAPNLVYLGVYSFLILATAIVLVYLSQG